MKSLVRLDFMVDPDALKTKAFVPDPVRVVVTDPESIFITGILGESGRKLVAAGIVFIMTRPLAERLMAHGVAVEANVARVDASRPPSAGIDGLDSGQGAKQ